MAKVDWLLDQIRGVCSRINCALNQSMYNRETAHETVFISLESSLSKGDGREIEFKGCLPAG
jgi:hypothetical protein